MTEIPANTPQQCMQPPPQLQPAAKPKKRIPLWVAIVAGLVLSLVSCSTGAAMSSGAPATVPASGPTVTVTETAAAEEEEVTPKSCLDALEYADQGFQLASKGFGGAANMVGLFDNAVTAAVDYDTAGMNRVADKLRKQTSKLKQIRVKTDKVVDPYIDARDECRSHG